MRLGLSSEVSTAGIGRKKLEGFSCGRHNVTKPPALKMSPSNGSCQLLCCLLVQPRYVKSWVSSLPSSQ